MEIINVGTVPNDFTGDPIRDAFIKVNENFDELIAIINASGHTHSISEIIGLQDELDNLQSQIDLVETDILSLSGETANIPTIQADIISINNQIMVINQSISDILGLINISSANFIPLSGTTSGSPVTGSIQLSPYGQNGNFYVSGGTNSGGIYINSTEVSLAQKNLTGDTGSYLTVFGDRIRIYNENPLARGLSAEQDFSSNLQSLDFPQKVYVDAGLATKQNTIGYTPENIANKVTGFTSSNNTTYPTTLAVDTALSAVTASIATAVTGLTIGYMRFISPAFTPLSGTTYYFADGATGLFGTASTSNISRRVSAMATGHFRKAHVATSVGLGAGSPGTIAVHLDNITQGTSVQLISNLSASGNIQSTNLDIDLAVTRGDLITLRIVTSAWISNPTNFNVYCDLTIEK